MSISQTDINRIKDRASLYNEALHAIEKRRETWQKTTKKRICDTLEEMKGAVDMGWTVGTYEHKKNLESIYITFPNKQSGIPMLKEEGESEHIKFGGYLCYTQSSNGKVHVWINFPTIEKIKDQEERKVLGEYDPSDIAEDMIVGDVEQFLVEMVKWENYHKEPIGFKLKGA